MHFSKFFLEHRGVCNFVDVVWCPKMSIARLRPVARVEFQVVIFTSFCAKNVGVGRLFTDFCGAVDRCGQRGAKEGCLDSKSL